MTDNQIEFDETWSDWNSLEGDNPAPQESGVYCVRATSDGSIAIPIPRVLGVDNAGIVYIGESKNLIDRVGRLMWIYDSSPDKHQHHSFISTWFYFNLDRLASRKLLRVRWKITSEHMELQNRLLNDYIKAFGERPVGNFKTG